MVMTRYCLGCLLSGNDTYYDEIMQAMSQRDYFKYIKDENMYKH